jgi:DNA-directed RNA polymerase beta' subunit
MLQFSKTTTKCSVKRKGISFATSSLRNIVDISEMEVKSSELYDNSKPQISGLLDPHLVR